LHVRAHLQHVSTESAADQRPYRIFLDDDRISSTARVAIFKSDDRADALADQKASVVVVNRAGNPRSRQDANPIKAKAIRRCNSAARSRVGPLRGRTLARSSSVAIALVAILNGRS
jgi:hypothetical protein